MGQDGAHQATQAGHTQGSPGTPQIGLVSTKGNISPCSQALRDALTLYK